MSVEQRAAPAVPSEVSITCRPSVPGGAHSGAEVEGRPATALERRLSSVRWSAALVLGAFLINAGLAVVLVAWISGSVLVALGSLAAMGLFVFVFAAFADSFLLSATGARRLLPGEFPWLEPMVNDLAGAAGIEPPEVLVSDQDALNAYTTGTGRRTKVVFMAGLIHELTREEIRAVAAHELGHVVNRDISLGVWSWAVASWVTLVSVLSLALATLIYGFSRALGGMGEKDGDAAGLLMMFTSILFIAFALFIRVVTYAWGTVSRLAGLAVTRQREFLADATAVAITRDPHALASALARIAESPHIERGGGSVARFCIMSPVVSSRWWEEMTSTHPSPEQRIEALSRVAADDLPTLDSSWEGIGRETWVLPAGAVGVMVVLAILIPSL